MSDAAAENIEEQLKLLLDESLPNQAVYNINAAMELAGILENKGFTFKLKDLCPKSMVETNWRATFLIEGATFSAENPQSALAVCIAAVGTLKFLSEKNENN